MSVSQEAASTGGGQVRLGEPARDDWSGSGRSDEIAPDLAGVSETMLWALHNRATEARRRDGILVDPDSVRIHEALDLPSAVSVQPVRRSGTLRPAGGQRAQRFRLARRAGAGRGTVSPATAAALFPGRRRVAMPEIYDFLEAEGFGYAIRLPANKVLQEKTQIPPPEFCGHTQDRA